MNDSREIHININIMNSFNEVYIPIMSSRHRYKVIGGGRGSGKSRFTSDFLVFLYLKMANRNCLALRKTAKSCRTSVYNYIKSCISRWGLQDLVEINIQMMTFTFPNGNQIICGGLDDADKLKSIQFKNGADLTDVWFEEGDQINYKDFETLDFTLRGENPQVIFTFNPVSKQNWIYKYFWEKQQDNTLRMITNYTQNRFLNKDFIKRMEKLKQDDPELYKIIGLGEWGNLKDIVYRRFEVEDFTKNEDYYDTILWGLDLGFNDPCALVKVGVKDSELYVLDEIYIGDSDSEELFDLMKNTYNVPLNALIQCDHMPMIQARLRKLGYKNIVNAIKTNKEQAVFQLSCMKIHVHSDCVNFIKEISTYRWLKDANGNIIDKLIDGNDHLMDSFLYACRPYLDRKVNDSFVKPRAKVYRRR